MVLEGEMGDGGEEETIAISVAVVWTGSLVEREEVMEGALGVGIGEDSVGVDCACA